MLVPNVVASDLSMPSGDLFSLSAASRTIDSLPNVWTVPQHAPHALCVDGVMGWGRRLQPQAQSTGQLGLHPRLTSGMHRGRPGPPATGQRPASARSPHPCATATRTGRGTRGEGLAAGPSPRAAQPHLRSAASQDPSAVETCRIKSLQAAAPARNTQHTHMFDLSRNPKCAPMLAHGAPPAFFMCTLCISCGATSTRREVCRQQLPQSSR